MFWALSLKCIDFFPLLLLLSSRFSKAGTTENWMVGFCEIQMHFLFSSVPRSIWFVIVSSFNEDYTDNGTSCATFREVG